MEQVLFRHNRPGRPVTFAEYCGEGGFGALRKALGEMSPADVQQAVIDSGLRGRGGAGFPTGMKWSFVPKTSPKPSISTIRTWSQFLSRLRLSCRASRKPLPLCGGARWEPPLRFLWAVAG